MALMPPPSQGSPMQPQGGQMPPQGGPPMGPPGQPQQPQGGAAQGGGRLDPAKITSLAQALTPDNFGTLMQIWQAVMVDAYKMLQSAGQQSGPPQGQAQPNVPTRGPAPTGMMAPQQPM